MDYRNAFAISASGLNVEKTRLDVTASNIANVHTVKNADGSPFSALTSYLDSSQQQLRPWVLKLGNDALKGAKVALISEVVTPPRKVYEPASPDADAQGYVSLPAVNLVTEMVNLSSALRAYEANVVAMNAAKTMAVKALELGGGR